MAVQLDTKTQSEALKAKSIENQKIGFKILKIALIAVMGIIVIASIAQAINISNKSAEQIEANAKIHAEFDNMKAQALANKTAIEEAKKEEEGMADSSEKIDRNMYSAQEAGELVCKFLDMAFKDELVLDADKEQWRELTNNASTIWYGDNLNYKESPIKWELLTWYDSTDKEYEVVWGCYAPDSNGVYKYLLALKFGKYNGETNSFSIGGLYYTTFGSMYERNGKIESDDVDDIVQDVESMVDQLTGGSNSGTTVDPGNNSNTTVDSGDNSNNSDNHIIFPGTPSGNDIANSNIANSDVANSDAANNNTTNNNTTNNTTSGTDDVISGVIDEFYNNNNN